MVPAPHLVELLGWHSEPRDTGLNLLRVKRTMEGHRMHGAPVDGLEALRRVCSEIRVHVPAAHVCADVLRSQEDDHTPASAHRLREEAESLRGQSVTQFSDTNEDRRDRRDNAERPNHHWRSRPPVVFGQPGVERGDRPPERGPSGYANGPCGCDCSDRRREPDPPCAGVHRGGLARLPQVGEVARETPGLSSEILVVDRAPPLAIPDEVRLRHFELLLLSVVDRVQQEAIAPRALFGFIALCLRHLIGAVALLNDVQIAHYFTPSESLAA